MAETVLISVRLPKSLVERIDNRVFAARSCERNIRGTSRTRVISELLESSAALQPVSRPAAELLDLSHPQRRKQAS